MGVGGGSGMGLEWEWGREIAGPVTLCKGYIISEKLLGEGSYCYNKTECFYFNKEAFYCHVSSVCKAYNSYRVYTSDKPNPY